MVRAPKRKDFFRYAVAYGRPYAVVSDDSVIPFALASSKKAELPRFELPFLKNRKPIVNVLLKASEAPERKARLVTTSPRPTARPKKVRVRTTAYTHNEADHLRYGRKNAIGTRLRYGKVRSAAADWSRYPVGTRFTISGQPGIVYEVDDYGSALVGMGTIDLYKPTFSAMNRWGVRHVDIHVLKWGSVDRSVKILKPRTKWSHVRRMFQALHHRRGQGQSEEARIASLPGYRT